MKTLYCGAFYIKKVKEKYFCLVVTDSRYPSTVKPLGGKGNPGEGTVEAMLREFSEESNKLLTPKTYLHVFQEVQGEHTRDFYLVTEIAESMHPGEGIIAKETEGSRLNCRLVEIELCDKILFDKARPAFRAICEKMREMDPAFTFCPS